MRRVVDQTYRTREETRRDIEALEKERRAR